MHSSETRGLTVAPQGAAGSNTSTPPHELAAFEGYLIDRRRWLVTHRGEPIPLKRKAFDMLLYFLDHPDEVVDKETLMRALWGNLIVEESNITQQIFLLRKALCKHASGIKIIETIPGRGYRFVPSLEFPSREPAVSGVFLRAHSSRVTMTISEESEDEPKPPVEVVQSNSRNRRWDGFLAVYCAVFALGGYGLRYWQDRGGPTTKIFAAMQDSAEGERPPARDARRPALY
jgi:DNA-binding winged helix-turn-helix (wHTH) protein